MRRADYERFDPTRHASPPIDPAHRDRLAELTGKLLAGGLKPDERDALDLEVLALGLQGASRLKPVELGDSPPSALRQRDQDDEAQRLEAVTVYRERCSRLIARNLSSGDAVVRMYYTARRLYDRTGSHEVRVLGDHARRLLATWGIDNPPEDQAAAHRHIRAVSDAWIPDPWRPRSSARPSSAKQAIAEVQV